MNEPERVMTCIICPKGCRIEVRGILEDPSGLELDGYRCDRGRQWVTKEFTTPERIICTSVLVTGGRDPLCSVRTDRPIPRERIRDLMNHIQTLVIRAPIERGMVIEEHPLGLACSLVATRSVSLQTSCNEL